MKEGENIMTNAKETEYYFEFRGQGIGVEADSLESAYGYFYIEYPDVSKEELDEAYKGDK
tara:strand:+ start:284 stop:463 length:180 start_codon:yes stop_codon:yes gene_type:complete